jgi:hypothetical protein
VRVRRSREGSLRWWCGFHASVSAREGRRWDKELPKDEANATSSSWLNGKKVRHGAAV